MQINRLLLSLVKIQAVIMACAILRVAPAFAEDTASIEASWSQVQDAISHNDFGAAAEALQAVSEKKNAGGFQALEPYSLWLIAEGERRLQSASPEELAFFANYARELTPHSSVVILRSLRLLQREKGDMVEQLKHSWQAIRWDRIFLLEVIGDSIYPLLWALTFALYIGFVVVFAHDFPSLMRPVARYVPFRVRGFFAPLITGILVGLPVMAGPLWAIAIWGLVVLLFLPRMRWISFFSGLVVCLWASCIPVRENLRLRLADEGVRAVLRVTAGVFSPGDYIVAENVAARSDDDPIALYAYGQALRAEGKFTEATEAFSQAERIWQINNDGARKYAVAQLGVLRLLQQDSQGAIQRFQEAEQLGLDSPEFYVTFSRAYFELLDTVKSRAYFERAQKKAPWVTEQAQRLEDQFGLKSFRSFIDIPLPVSLALKLLLVPVPGSSDLHDQRVQALMSPLTPISMGALAIVLIVGFLVRGEAVPRVHREVPQAWRSSKPVVANVLRAIPGAAWICQGRFIPGLFLLTFVSATLLTLVGWPRDTVNLYFYLPSVRPVIVSGIVLFAMGVVYVGLHLKPRVKE